MFGITKRLALGALVLGVLGTSCGPATSGSITPAGFAHASYKYSVKAQPDGTLMSPQWKLDNYYTKQKRLVEKNSKDYVVTYELDKNGDGEYETKAEQHLYDLRFKNLVHDGTIFIRTIPISGDLGQKKLSVLMQNYIEAIAGGGYEVVQLNPQDRVMIEKRYAAAIDDQGPGKLAGLPAHVATISVANTEQLKVDPHARSERVQLVLLHTHFAYRPFGSSKRTTFPVLLLAGYANKPGDFNAGLGDFQKLLNRIVIDGAQGYSYAPTAAPAPVAQTPASAARAPAAAPAAAAPAVAAPPAAAAPASATPASATPTPAVAPAPAAAPTSSAKPAGTSL